MIKQEQFNRAIKVNDINTVKLLLKDSRVDPSDSNNSAIKISSRRGYLDIVNLLLYDTRVNPSNEDNYAIRYASTYGHINVVKILLNDKRVNPSDKGNWAIYYANKEFHANIVNLLWKNIIVKNSLQKDQLKLYDQLTIEYIKNKVELF
jgi:hypothetical protein